MTSEYERIRLKNIADNKRILGELGFLNPVKLAVYRLIMNLKITSLAIICQLTL